ncbi:hypothetical protein DV096_15340 [Bradymonadaceae bacterium TMQ3]|nr:hypothetical protein DV096_15340 [Bradymonadaceae bacterium TMQ3]TXC74717.1 hypothetical protein FRC91_14240 [Bradymonadales bacterium TMQ1]
MELGRWIREFQRVWKVSFVDLGLVILGCAVGFMVPGLLVQRVGSPLALAAFWAVSLPVIAWLAGAAHLLCVRNAEADTSTSFGDALQEAFERWDDVVLGVVFCGLMLGAAGMLVLPGVVACGVLLPYVVIVMAEKMGPIEALRRNIELAQGRWVALVVYWLVYYAAFVFGTTLLGVVAAVTATLGLGSALEVGSLMAIVGVVSCIGAFFLAPLPVIASVATYRFLVERTPASAAVHGGRAGESGADLARTDAPRSSVAAGEAGEDEQTGEPVGNVPAALVEAAPTEPSASPADDLDGDREGVEDDAPFEVERGGLAGESVFDDDEEATSTKPTPGFPKVRRADEGPYW